MQCIRCTDGKNSHRVNIYKNLENYIEQRLQSFKEIENIIMIEIAYWKMRCLVGGIRVLLEYAGAGKRFLFLYLGFQIRVVLAFGYAIIYSL